MTQTIRYAVDADGIAQLVIDVPGRPMNVMTPEFLNELGECVARIASDASVRGAVISSARSSFMAGADIKDMVGMFDRGITAQQATEFSNQLTTQYRRLETCGKPVVAAINGVALGGGYELALACHCRVLADDAQAVVGLPEVKIGLMPGAGGTQRLPRLIGVVEALKLLTDGRQVGPQEALKKGLVHEIAPAAEIVACARQWILRGGEGVQPWDQKGFRVPGGAGMSSPAVAQAFMAGTALTARTTMRNYPAPLAILSCVYEGTQLPIDTALKLESQHFGQLLAGPVSRNLMRTMFVNKGLADKLSRRPAGVPKGSVRRLGILGAGMMGAGIAHGAALAGIETVLLDTTLELAEKGRAYTQQLLAKDVERGKRTQADADAILARIRATTSYADLAGCDLVVEAVFEKREIKADVTRAAEAVSGADAVFASNTSTLPISGLAQASKRPQQFIGMHFFSPVDRMPLVEIIVGRKTSEATVARALDFVGQLRKTPIVVNDSRGFYTSRCFGTFVNEGMQMLQEGVAPALIENAAKMAGMAVGPLAVEDEVTIELTWRVFQQSAADLGARYQRPPGYDVVETMVEKLRRPGRRFGGGFYEYPAGAKKFLWPGLTHAFPLSPQQPTLEEAQKRLMYIQSLETSRCLEEGVLTSAAEADLGSILGWGFPAWTGGTLSYIDMIGLDAFIADCDRLAKKYGKRFRPSKWLRERAARGQRFHDASAEQPAAETKAA
jgi:3-hydroxyacyl-CoA dehydrogenase/enoyl-CoA hydratase/3-hydroxybutyryl-CoA epimerase